MSAIGSFSNWHGVVVGRVNEKMRRVESKESGRRIAVGEVLSSNVCMSR